jgi:glycosyltransferase involved in cell wall biosynthesis
MPQSLSIIRSIVKKVDCFQLRTPLGMGVFLIPYLTFFSDKKGWYKYAGNWNQDRPPLGYRVQRWFLKNQNRKVTINGKWKDQPKQCLTFENPCLSTKDRLSGQALIAKKEFSKPYNFCFVGRLEDEKGVQRILDAFNKFTNIELVGNIDFVGDGEKMKDYKRQARMNNLPINFYGFLRREEVFDIYKRCSFLLLPSTASEGFPKVIAEAMNFGCIPIVSDISSIGQYVNEKNGYLIQNITASSLLNIFNEITATPEAILKEKALAGYDITNKFTFENYRNRIFKEILN